MRILNFTLVASQISAVLSKRMLNLFSFLLIVFVGLSGCTSGSGSDNDPAVGSGGGGGGGPGYTGPAPLDASVQAFKLSFWDNLEADNRCGTCHEPGGVGGAYPFVRDDDINLAYQAALLQVDIANPAQSRFVERMNEDHHCWDNSTAVCVTQMTNYISEWLNATSAAATQIVILPPSQTPLPDPGASYNHPDTPDIFRARIYPLLQLYCSNCHRSDGPLRQQSPYFASTDIDIAYNNAKQRINLNNPTASRFVQRLDPELHNCWDTGGGVNCPESSAAMLDAINLYIQDLGGRDSVDTTALRVSKAVTFPGTPAQPSTTQGRYETNVIAKYEFQQLDPNDNTRVVDLSTQSPSLDLTLSGDAIFVPNVGVVFGGSGGVNGKAQGSTTNSRKLYDLLTLTNEYSIEAWVVPANVTQDNTRRIVSYSGGLTERNFTLGQNQYNYESLNRTTAATSSPNGDVLYATPDADEALQASLQHVVLSFDPVNGRRIYVNGQLATSAVTDDQMNSSLSNWNPAFVLVVGNETQSQDTDWRGTIRMLAIHSRVLSEEQILANFDVGIGQKYYLPFSVSHLLQGVSDAFIVFEVERYDASSYLFKNPFFTVLTSGANLPSDIRIQNIRIGIDGAEEVVGQAFGKTDVTLTNSEYQAAPNNWLYLSDVTGGYFPVGATIVESESDNPEFFLSFDLIDNLTSSIDRVGAVPSLVTVPTLDYEQSDIGLKHFYELSEMYSRITGVSKDDTSFDLNPGGSPMFIADKFDELKTSLPTTEDPVAFGTSNQMGIAQFAAAYCEVMTRNQSLRDAMWPTVNFASALSTQRDAVLQPLLQGLAAHRIGGSALGTQADPAALEAAIDTFFTDFPPAQSGSIANTEGTAIAVCTAVLSSAVATVQ